MDFINQGAVLLQDGIAYLQENAWYIVIMLGIGYYMKVNYIVPYLQNRHHRPEPERKINYEADMRRVRLQQQELARERAIEAAKERKAMEEEAKLRKNKAALPPGYNEGDRLGRSSNNSFNPLEPWTQSNGGGSYKPAKRSICRGCP